MMSMSVESVCFWIFALCILCRLQAHQASSFKAWLAAWPCRNLSIMLLVLTDHVGKDCICQRKLKCIR